MLVAVVVAASGVQLAVTVPVPVAVAVAVVVAVAAAVAVPAGGYAKIDFSTTTGPNYKVNSGKESSEAALSIAVLFVERFTVHMEQSSIQYRDQVQQQ